MKTDIAELAKQLIAANAEVATWQDRARAALIERDAMLVERDAMLEIVKAATKVAELPPSRERMRKLQATIDAYRRGTK